MDKDEWYRLIFKVVNIFINKKSIYIQYYTFYKFINTYIYIDV